MNHSYQLEKVELRNLAEAGEWFGLAQPARAFRLRLAEQLQQCLPLGASAVYLGFCVVCDRHSHFTYDWQYSDGATINWRERLTCMGCGLNNRLRLALHAVDQRLPHATTAKIYLTEQLTPIVDCLRHRCGELVCSEYLGPSAVPGGIDERGIRHEDLTRLSFEDRSFDAVFSFDVLEHVPDYQKGLQEVFRVLKPGGMFLMSAPFHLGSSRNIVRARIDVEGRIEHLLEPEYHGDPVSPDGGVLCFYHFGWQLLDEMRSVGFTDVVATLYWSSDYAYIGEEQLLLHAVK